MNEREDMNKNNDTDWVEVIGRLVALVLMIGFLWVLFIGIRGVYRWGVTQNAKEFGYYCESKKQILSIEPVYEDDGKYEDEAYIIKYTDGTVGATSNPDETKSGFVCINRQWLEKPIAEQRGYVNE